jgi:molybdopterin-guanine dinucleotide biosynthesis protein A
MYDAIVLAGGVNSEQLRQYSCAEYEALIEIHGKPMVTFVVDALLKVEEVRNIVVVGPEKELHGHLPKERVKLVASADGIIGNVLTALQNMEPTKKVIVATADIPMLTPEAVCDFLQRCSQQEADFYYPIVAREANEGHYPGMRRTYVKLREGTFTGGNIFLVDPVVVGRCVEAANKIVAQRKNPFQLSRLLGLRFIIQFLLGTLTLPAVAKRVSEILNLRGAVVVSAYPELGIDVDKPSDLDLVRNQFTLRA